MDYDVPLLTMIRGLNVFHQSCVAIQGMSSSYNFRGNKRQDENQLTSDGEACVASDNLYVKRCDLGSFESNDVTRLQALVDKKKVVVTEAAIRDVLRLDDAEGVDCLPNEKIFGELARMGYEKPSIKLTFYKAFFSSQCKFLIHTILQSISAKRTSWNEFSSTMASAVICLSTGVETSLFEGMLVAREPEEQGDADEEDQGNDNDAAQGANTAVSGDDVHDQSIPSPAPPTPPPQPPQDIPSTFQLKTRVKKLERDNKVKALKLRRLKKFGTSQRIESSDDIDMEDASNQGRMIDELDRDTDVALMKDKPVVQEAMEVVTTAKLITEVVAAVSESVSAASATIAVVPAATITAAPVRVAAAFTKRRKGVVEEPKPMKKKQQVKMDEEYARKLHEELNQDIDWDVAIDHVKQKAKEDPYVQRYQVMKKRPQTEAQARRNMIMYLKNVVGFRLDYFKGMSYDDIRPIFEAKFNSNIEFLLKSKEQIEEKENRAIEKIVPDKDDDVYTEANPLSRKVPVVDYQIIQLNNKPRYKIIRADGTHQLYVSFITLMKNFDREDLESLWSIVKERFSTLKPNNYSNDYLLTTLRAMFERPNGQDQVWKSQRTNFASRKKIPTLEVYARSNAACSETSSGRAKTAEVDLVRNNEALGINLDLLVEKREDAAIREAKSKAKMEKYYNSKVQNTSFKPGDLVYRNNDASRAEDIGKLGPKWEGPYEVTEALGKGTYKLKDRDRKQLPRTWNIKNLKKCYIHKM
nr:reverse transcriptase domain-containing protein [Tanacetum cinerariifolium]